MVTEAFFVARNASLFGPEEEWRKLLLKNSTNVNVLDFGAGSKSMGSVRSVREITRASAVAPRYGRLLASLVEWSNAQRVLELGTSVGVGTMYLSKFAQDVVSIDACPQTQAVAMNGPVANCRFETGGFSEILPRLAEEKEFFDFVYIDGNHTFDGTLDNFDLVFPLVHDQSIIVFDDINWSVGMQKAWAQISNDSRVRVTVNLWQMGIVLLRPEMSKQNFVVRY